MNLRAVGFLFFLTLLIGFCIAASSENIAKAEDAAQMDQFTAWLPYWDTQSALADVMRFRDDLDRLIYFAAYFDQDSKVFIPEDMFILTEGTDYLYEDTLPTRYLSIVNDQVIDETNNLLKDTALLHRILATPEQTQAHIEEVIGLAQTHGYDGIEIDYEAIRDDMPLWDLFLAFIEQLYMQTSQYGLELRVLLEPSAPLASLNFPQGPEYVMMCYNLYGNHSGPGPKADVVFLQDLVLRMESLPGRKTFALATGGFDWSTSAIKGLTRQEAVDLQQIFDAKTHRDPASGAVYYYYQDDDGNDHEVWFADEETLLLWRQTIQQMGPYSIDIWRLGGY